MARTSLHRRPGTVKQALVPPCTRLAQQDLGSLLAAWRSSRVRRDSMVCATLRRMNLMLFLSVHRGGRRRIEQVWESDGQHPHRLVYQAGDSGPIELSNLVTAPAQAAAGKVIERLLASGRRTVEDVRTLIVQSRRP